MYRACKALLQVCLINVGALRKRDGFCQEDRGCDPLPQVHLIVVGADIKRDLFHKKRHKGPRSGFWPDREH